MSKGKYSELVKTLKRITLIDTDWQQRINTEKGKYPKLVGKPGAAAAKYDALRVEKVKLEEQATALNLKIAAVEQILWNAYEDAGIESLRLENGKPISVYDEVSVKATDKLALLKWIRRHKLANLLTMHAGTLATLTKDRLLAQQEAPDGVAVGTFKRTKRG